MIIIVWILFVIIITIRLVLATSPACETCAPLVLGHRGASAYLPEHTIESYGLAISVGSDYIEVDLVMTKDGHLIARHNNSLNADTDVSLHRGFIKRYQRKIVNDEKHSGWFTEDFTLKEIKLLHATRPKSMNRKRKLFIKRTYKIPTLQHIIDFVKHMEKSRNCTIGIALEIKQSTYFRKIGLPMEKLLVKTLHKNGYRGLNAPIYIQSYEISNLKDLRRMTNLRLLQLLHTDKYKQPYDQVKLGTGITYEDMATPDGLKEIASYAAAVGVTTKYIFPYFLDHNLLDSTSFVKDAHDAGLKVFVKLRPIRDVHIPLWFRAKNFNRTFDILKDYVNAYQAMGVEALYSDRPEVALRFRECSHMHRLVYDVE